MEINLDEMRAARAEVLEQEPATLVFHDERFVLPQQIPIALLEHLALYLTLAQERQQNPEADDATTRANVGTATKELLAAGEVILGPAGWARFKELGADYSDVLSLLTAVIRIFKLGEDGAGTEADVVGESQASDSPSSDSGESSRPTSNGTTEAISDETSSAEDSRSDVSAS